MPTAASLLIVLLISYTLGRLVRKFYFSEVIGLIIAGLIISLPALREHLISGHESIFGIMSQFGLQALMFLSGFEVSGNMLYREEKEALFITFSTVLVSLFVGTGVMLALGFGLSTSLVVGICFGITAEATKARVLIQLKKLKTRIGALLMGIGITNDLFGIALFSFILYFSTKSFFFKEIRVLLGMIIAFVLGMLVHYYFNRFSRKIRILEKIMLRLVVPFFFIHMGMLFNNNVSSLNIKILLIILISSLLGQLFGVMIVKPFSSLNWPQTFLVGFGMNLKGALELAIAHIALQSKLLTPALYSSIVVVTLISTIVSQIVIFSIIKKYPKIMD